jgi:hypothetical protein
VAFRFQKSSCVVVGTFNIYIVQPHLLLEINAVNADDKPDGEIKFEADFSQPGFRFEFMDQKIKCTVRPDRFLVESDDSAVDCGRVVGTLVQTLRYTPFMALGINSHYSTDNADDIQNLCREYLPNFQDAQAASIKQRTVHAAVSVGSAVVNLQVALKENVADFSANCHVQLDGKGDRDAIAEIVRVATGDFFEWNRTSRSLARDLFKLEFENATDHV